MPKNDDGSCNAYRLKHLGTNTITSHNVRQLYPYISKKSYVQKATPHNDGTKTPNDVLSNEHFEPQPGSFLLFPNFGDVPYHLVQVESVTNGDVKFYYFNTTDPKRLLRFRPVWTHDSKIEIQAMTLNRKGYVKRLHSAPIEVFCQHEIPVMLGNSPKTKQVGTGVHLTKTNVNKVMKYAPLADF